MHISTKLQRFCILCPTNITIPHELHIYDKKMILRLESETCLGHWIEMQLLRETESLYFSGNGAEMLDFARCPNIRCLKLSECETTKNIVTTCAYDDADATMFPSSLEDMELYSLPQLQEISISFQNLSSIRIGNCPRLPNLSKLSIAGNDCFPQLQELCIQQCEMMEQVLLWKEEENNSESRTNPHVKFPKLEEVRFDSLPNLVNFCQGVEGIEFPLLRKIHVKECPKWTSMVSSSGFLESKENQTRDIDDEYSSHLFCQLQKALFDNLKELEVVMNPFCGHEIPVTSSYNGLETLNISGYEGSNSLLSPLIARNLVNLKTLGIRNCDEIVQVIKDDDDDKKDMTRVTNTNYGGERPLLFPKLEELWLEYLPKLVSFWERKCDHVVLPSLRRGSIRKCPNMKNLSLAAPNLEAFTTDLNNDLGVGVNNVSFDRLKTLWIEEVGNVGYPFYHLKFFISLVDGLEKLHLHGHRSMSLFSYSITGKLLNLRLLRLSGCDEMVKVIEEEEEDQVVSGSRTALLFPKLEDLQLLCLPKLVSFCESRKHGVELPFLRNVNIFGCPMMKYISRGPLTAPNLENIQIDDQFFRGEKDLNGMLQQQYSARAKQEEEEEEGDEEIDASNLH